MKLKRFLKSLFLSLCCLMFAGCSSLFQNESDGQSGSSSITVTLPSAGRMSERDAVSSEEAQNYKYEITFTLQDGEYTNTVIAKGGETVKQENLEPGTYIITGKAYNSENALAYQGSTSAVVKNNENTDVTLVMSSIIGASDKHITVETDAAGVKITLNYASGDGSWKADYVSKITEKESGIFMPILNLPSSGKNVTYYFPFTQKDKSYTFNLYLKTSDAEFSETVKCKAGGGDDSFITYNSNYTDSIVSLDASTFSTTFAADPFTIFDQSKFNDTYCTQAVAVVDVLSGTDFLFNRHFDYYNTEEGFTGNTKELTDGVNFYAEGFSYIDELIEKGTWRTGLYVSFCLASYPDVIYSTKQICSQSQSFTMPGGHNSKHVTLTTDPKGIKATFKFLDGDGSWASYTKLEECTKKYALELEYNTLPSAENPEVSFIYPITTSGKMYGFHFTTDTDEGWIDEFVCAEAGGGHEDYFTIDDSWSDIQTIMDSTNFTINFDENIIEKAISSTALSDGSFTQIYLKYDIMSGAVDWTDTDWICYGTYYYMQDGIVNTEGTKQWENGYDITNGDVSVKYKFGKHANWSSLVRIIFKISDCSTYLTLPMIETEIPYTGAVYDMIDKTTSYGDYGWQVLLFCEKSMDPGFTYISSTENSINFSFTKDFDNSGDFEFQIKKPFTTTIGKKYQLSAGVESSVAGIYDLSVWDDTSYSIMIPGAGTLDGLTKSTLESDGTTSAAGTLCHLFFRPYSAGTYTLSDVELSEMD